MLEQLLSEIVEQRLTEALTQFRLAPQIKPHALVEAKNRLEVIDFFDRLQTYLSEIGLI